MTNTILFFIHTIFVSFSLIAASLYRKEMLISLVCLMGVLSNIFIVKQVNIFGYDVTCTDVFAVGLYLGLNLIQEYWGKEEAKKTIWFGFACSLFFLLMTQFHLLYTPNMYDTTSLAFENIFQYTPRIIGASFVTYILCQHFECFAYGKLKQYTEGRHFLIRNYATLIVSQLIDTVLFSFLGLYGIVGNITHIIIVSYFIKIAVILIAAPLISITRFTIKARKNHE